MWILRHDAGRRQETTPALIWSGLVNHQYNYYIAIALASEYATEWLQAQ